YRRNFETDSIQMAIERITPKFLAPLAANAWFMSPPCQPYTRTGKMLDEKDARAKGLIHLIGLLGRMPSPPTYIFLENVLNFEKSRSRDLLIRQLTRLGYDFTEWLLTPLQFGIPNDRVRYFLTARRRAPSPSGEVSPPEWVSPPLDLRRDWPWSAQYGSIPPVGDYLEPEVDADAFRVPDTFVKKRRGFSETVLAKPTDTRTSCFTKAYGHHGLGAGAFVQTRGFDVSYVGCFKRMQSPEFFTPTEIARLHAFPIDGASPTPPPARPSAPARHAFAFPDTLSTVQRWRVLGNSMNVKVVGELMRCALFGSDEWGGAV
ncbi:S-adenosyl-L-methionine-dependent methyltransferase, partial [Blyttiomyces helicus]